MSNDPFTKALELIDAANSEDPNIEQADGKDWPKELLYSNRMTDMLNRFKPDADGPQQVAIRAQHIERWKSPRTDYPMDRVGYLKWRKDLYVMQADTCARLMREAGCDEEGVKRSWTAVAKKSIKSNPDSQLLEDIADLTFIEHYMAAFAGKHPEYSEEKWIEIIQKTWNKMSSEAQQFALSGSLKLPEPLVPLIQKAVA